MYSGKIDDLEHFAVDVRAGSWCEKFGDFITIDTVEKCEFSKSKDFKGCYWCSCRTYVVKSRRIKY